MAIKNSVSNYFLSSFINGIKFFDCCLSSVGLSSYLQSNWIQDLKIWETSSKLLDCSPKSKDIILQYYNYSSFTSTLYV